MLGRTIGNYEVISQFGEGGMGELYLGRHTRLAREVVIKTIRTEDFNPRQIEHLRERLEREAYIQSQLDHENIVRVYDFISAGETTCIVMEFVPGRDLRKMILHETGPIPYPRALLLFKQILEAIKYAHDFKYTDKSDELHRGIIHRDLKPANILVTPEDRVKVTDFGIVKVRGVKGGTQMGFNPGTPEYMSPEQARGRELDHRSDIYSLGIVLYEMLTGRVPFDMDGAGTSDYEIRRGHIELPVPPLSKFRRGIPGGLEAIVLKALEKNPDNRFQSAKDFLDAIKGFELTGVQTYGGPRKTVVQPVDNPPNPDIPDKTVVTPPIDETEIGDPEESSSDEITIPIPDEKKPRPTSRTIMISIGIVIVAAAVISWWILSRAPMSVESGIVGGGGISGSVSVPQGMISIPGGEFSMGRDDGNDFERPSYKVQVKPFFIDHYEVTNDEYAKFLRQTRRNPPSHWREGQYENGEARLPVVNVTWYEARAFCEWAGKRLPFEPEWEYTARGRDNRLYPYGNEWKPRFSNALETGLDKPQAVGSYPEGDSAFGVADLAGNVAEWTETEYKPYPGSRAKTDEGNRVIRGGGFRVPAREQTATERFFDRPTASYDFVGFRCAKDQSSGQSGTKE